MNNLTAVVHQLKQAQVKAQRELRSIDLALSALTNLSVNGPKRSRRTMSAAARRKISLAQKARWAKQKRKA
jgi:hypothetical protein